MAKRKGSPASRESASSSQRESEGMDERVAREVDNTQHRLDKLPHEVWEKILDEIGENDLFPLALSCRYFRQKQKDLVARTRQHEVERRKPRLALKTTLHSKPVEGQPASADYLRFCSKEHVGQVRGKYVYGITYTDKHRDSYVRKLTAFLGHLPLLQELFDPASELEIASEAGESPSSQSPLLSCFGF